MKLQSYWTDTAPAFQCSEHPLPAHVDVAIVGAGFTGLSSALSLSRSGARVIVLDAGPLAGEASGRNGGHVNNGLSVDYVTVADQVGPAQAAAWYQAYDAAVDTVERLVREEAIDCDFVRRGKLKLAVQPAHYDSIARGFDRLRREADPDVELISHQRLRQETNSQKFVGGLLYKKAGQMHVGRFAHGLAQSVARAGVDLHPHTMVEGFKRAIGPSGTQVFRLQTARGTVTADQVLLATGATRHGPFSSFSYWRRRIVPVGSFIIVTKPLDVDLAHRLLPNRRTYVTTENLHNYFRLTPDHRLVFGGRARFAAMSNPDSDVKSGALLQRAMASAFPELADVGIDYCWGGLVDMTQDRLPRAGSHRGLHFAMGYSGHGVQMSVHMGQQMARILGGESQANPWEGHPWSPIPGHFGYPWFLPAVGWWFRLKDMLQ
jgi:glycine/D-amino acid oxidase-like deaminating enzyme